MTLDVKALYLRERFIDNVRLNSDTEKNLLQSSRKHRFSFTKCYYPILCIHGSRCKRRQPGKEYGCSCWSGRAQSIGWPLFLPGDWKKKKQHIDVHKRKTIYEGKSDSCSPEDGLVGDSTRYLPFHRYTTTPNRLRHGVNYVREQCFRRD